MIGRLGIRNRSLFVKLLLSMTVIVLVTVILISTVTYTISADTSIQNSIEYNQSILEQQRELIHKELNAVKNIASSMIMTQSYLFNTINDKLSVGSLIDLSRVVDEQQKLSPYVDSIYLAYGKQDLVLTSRSDMKMSPLSSFIDRSWLPEMNKDTGSRTVWLTGRSNGFAQGKSATSLMQKMPLIGPVEGTILINLKLDMLFKDYLGHYRNKKGTTVVLGPSGELLYSETDDAVQLASQLDPATLSEAGSGSYFFDRHWIVTYTTSELTGWKFVNLTKQSILLQGLNRIKIIVAAVAGLYVTVALVLSFFISQRLYRPLKNVVAYINGSNAAAGSSSETGAIRDSAAPPADEASFIRQSFEWLRHSQETILHEKTRVETLLGANRPAIKEKYLSDLVKGKAISPATFGLEKDAAELLGLRQDFTRFAILTLELEEPATLHDSTGKLRFHLLQYGVIDELEPEIEGDIFAIDDERTVIIHSVPSGEDEALIELARKLQRAIERRYGMTATFGISRIHTGVQAANTAYEESVEALSLKMYVGKGEIVPHAIVNSWKQDDETYYYPYELETKLLQALLQLDEAECAEQISRITQEVTARRLGKANVQQLFFQLSGEVVKTLVQTGGDMSVVFGEKSFALTGIQTIRDMETRLTDLCARIIAHNREKRLKLNDRTLQLATEFMEMNYNNNITIESVAQHVQRSTSFLSRIFKEATGTTINDYLIHLRIGRACELLRLPKYTLEDVCREIGYSNVSYFNKLFKSRTGHTPGQYRLLQAAEQSALGKRKEPDAT
ncbi:helix-turn-helix domain-containing protein [Paenibacillus ginsengarvi]|uniref:Helix-turn-helix domain-containing protein n=1 Tax=Paenibacillus ginsengarvi TaxID=400777 RepID=A0A3B0BTQ6_9BACL|nr:helix-turn-helix domain-containing protein [Paenibacillus ginsengarvi]RKN75841.1 helix-turn-helix domain-containing protein [Paenibacillus ginsengarvi]